MKKIKFLSLILLCSISLMACSDKNKNEDKIESNNQSTENTQSNEKLSDEETFINGVNEEHPLKVDKNNKTVTIFTKYNGKFEKESTRHLVTFKGGKLSDKSIFSSYVSPSDFYKALTEIGAEAGNNVNEDNADTEKTEGSELGLKLSWKENEDGVGLEDAIKDSNDKPIDIRFSGNIDPSKEYNTGCVTCLDSCFVGITSNATYPLGAVEESKEVEFKVDPANLPKDGEGLAITYKLK